MEEGLAGAWIRGCQTVRTSTVKTMAKPSISATSPEVVSVSTVAATPENPYAARYATLNDAHAIDHLVHAAFGNSVSKSSAARDIRSNKTTYIVVTKTSSANPVATDTHILMNSARWKHRLKWLFSSTNPDPLKSTSNVVGLVGIWTAMDQAHMVVIATHPNERRRGIGELLVLATIAEALKSGATNATLEVRKSNIVARSLYGKYGFSDVGIRHRYYHDNREDAIIMSTPSFSNLEYKRSLMRRWKGYISVRGKTKLQFDPTPYLS